MVDFGWVAAAVAQRQGMAKTIALGVSHSFARGYVGHDFMF